MNLTTVEAIYQNGIIKPLTGLRLRENERIRLRIERSPVQEKTRNIVHLRGIWKHALTDDEKKDWVSDTIAAIRRESDQKVEQSFFLSP